MRNHSIDTRQELMTVTKQTGKLQQVWFSTAGDLAFAWFSLPGNFHRIKFWDASNPVNTGAIDHQIVSALIAVVCLTDSPLACQRQFDSGDQEDRPLSKVTYMYSVEGVRRHFPHTTF